MSLRGGGHGTGAPQLTVCLSPSPGGSRAPAELPRGEVGSPWCPPLPTPVTAVPPDKLLSGKDTSAPTPTPPRTAFLRSYFTFSVLRRGHPGPDPRPGSDTSGCGAPASSYPGHKLHPWCFHALHGHRHHPDAHRVRAAPWGTGGYLPPHGLGLLPRGSPAPSPPAASASLPRGHLCPEDGRLTTWSPASWGRHPITRPELWEVGAPNPGTQPGGAAKAAVLATCHTLCGEGAGVCVSPRQVHGPPTWVPRTPRGRGPHRDTTELPPNRCR